MRKIYFLFIFDISFTSVSHSATFLFQSKYDSCFCAWKWEERAGHQWYARSFVCGPGGWRRYYCRPRPSPPYCSEYFRTHLIYLIRNVCIYTIYKHSASIVFFFFCEFIISVWKHYFIRQESFILFKVTVKIFWNLQKFLQRYLCKYILFFWTIH